MYCVQTNSPQLEDWRTLKNNTRKPVLLNTWACFNAWVRHRVRVRDARSAMARFFTCKSCFQKLNSCSMRVPHQKTALATLVSFWSCAIKTNLCFFRITKVLISPIARKCCFFEKKVLFFFTVKLFSVQSCFTSKTSINETVQRSFSKQAVTIPARTWHWPSTRDNVLITIASPSQTMWRVATNCIALNVSRLLWKVKQLVFQFDMEHSLAQARIQLQVTSIQKPKPNWNFEIQLLRQKQTISEYLQRNSTWFVKKIETCHKKPNFTNLCRHEEKMRNLRNRRFE